MTKRIFTLVCLSLTLLVVSTLSHDKITDYAVSTRTGAGPGCGTDAAFNLTFISSDNDKVTFTLDGEGDKLETSSRDRFNFTGKLVYPLDRMILQRVEVKGWSPDWYIHWLTVEVYESLYVFRINRWIKNDQVYQYVGTLGSCTKGFQRIQECRPMQ